MLAGVKKGLQQLERTEGRAGADTIRLWDAYQEQAYLWRALALIQIPSTALAIIAALVMYRFADTIIEVPQKPQPGYYSVKQLPDSEFVGVATELVNLIASYQYATAERQFVMARKWLWEPALSEFEESILKDDLGLVLSTHRSSLFFVDNSMIQVKRIPEKDQVVVRIPGLRQKLLNNIAVPPEEIAYYLTMTTIPRNVHNEYGIVVVDIKVNLVNRQTLVKQDQKEKSKANKKTN